MRAAMTLRAAARLVSHLLGLVGAPNEAERRFCSRAIDGQCAITPSAGGAELHPPATGINPS
jgi:hypothetical protein